MGALVLGLLLVVVVIGAGCGGDLNGHDPVEVFQPLTAEEQQAIKVMRAYIAASKALLQRNDIPVPQRSRLIHAIVSSRRALTAYIRKRREGKARRESLRVIGFAAAGIIADDTTLAGLADDVVLIPLGLAALTATMLTSAPASRDALVDSWNHVGETLDELGDSVEDAIKSTVDIVPVPADPIERARRCTPTPVCPHKGSDPIHNACADGAPPNMHKGCDVLVNGYHFDALGPSGRVLWEVKTDDWWSYPDWLRDKTARAHAKTARRENELAKACKFDFVFAVSDDELYKELMRILAGVKVRHVPKCRRIKKP